MDHHEQLLQLASEYQIWAKTRKHKNSAVPKTIKNTIADLCKYFSTKQIAMAVGVSQTSIYYWSDIQVPRSEKTKTTTKAAFIALPDINTPSLSSDIQLTLTNEKGMTFTVRGGVSSEQLRVIVEVMAQ